MSVRSIRAAAPRSSALVGALVLSATLGLAACGDDVVDDQVEQDVEEGVDDLEGEIDEEVDGGEETDG